MSSVLWAQDCGFAERAPRSCRNCTNYIRIQDNRNDNLPSTNVRRGFCMLGDGEGDYGLYVSSSRCQDCQGFMFDQTKAAITEEENKISDLYYSFEKKEGKQIAKILKATHDEMAKKNWFFCWIEERAETNKQFRIKHLDMLSDFEKKFDLSWKDYIQLRDLISNFCKQYIAAHPSPVNQKLANNGE